MNKISATDILSFVRTVVIVMVMGFCLFLGQYQHYFLLPAFALFFLQIKKEKSTHLVVISFIFLFLMDSFFYSLDFSSLKYFGENKNLAFFILSEGQSYFDLKIMTLGGLIFLLSLTFVYYRLKVLNPLVYLIGSFFLLTTLLSTLGKMTFLYQLIIATLLILAKSFWYIGLNLQMIRFSPVSPGLAQLSESIIPFWSYGLVRSHSVPNGWREIKFKLNQNPEIYQIQLSGIRLAILSLSLKYLSALLYKALFGMNLNLPLWGEFHFPSLELPNPFSMGFNHYNALSRPAWECFFVTLINPLLYILREPVGDGGVLIGFIRILGISAPAQVDRPYLAKNFNDFFKRIYFYYNYLLIEFFVVPLYHLMSHLDLTRKLRLFLSVLIAVYTGGVLLNYFRHDLWLVKYGPFEAFSMMLGRSYYFAGVAFLSAISAVRSKNERELIGFKKWAIPLAVYISYALVFSMQTSYKEDDLSDRIEFLIRLSGLQLN